MNKSFKEKLIIGVVSAIAGAIAGGAITAGVQLYLNAKTEDQMRADTEKPIPRRH